MEKKFKTDIGMYALRNGYAQSMRMNRQGLERLKSFIAQIEEDFETVENRNRTGDPVVAGKLFMSPVTEQTKSKFPNPDTAPDFFLRYLTKGEVEDFDAKKKDTGGNTSSFI